MPHQNDQRDRLPNDQEKPPGNRLLFQPSVGTLEGEQKCVTRLPHGKLWQNRVNYFTVTQSSRPRYARESKPLLNCLTKTQYKNQFLTGCYDYLKCSALLQFHFTFIVVPDELDICMSSSFVAMATKRSRVCDVQLTTGSVMSELKCRGRLISRWQLSVASISYIEIKLTINSFAGRRNCQSSS